MALRAAHKHIDVGGSPSPHHPSTPNHETSTSLSSDQGRRRVGDRFANALTTLRTPRTNRFVEAALRPTRTNVVDPGASPRTPAGHGRHRFKRIRGRFRPRNTHTARCRSRGIGDEFATLRALRALGKNGKNAKSPRHAKLLDTDSDGSTDTAGAQNWTHDCRRFRRRGSGASRQITPCSDD